MGASSIATQTAAAGLKAETGTATRDRNRLFAAPMGLAVVAFALIFSATPSGLGISPDSTQYLSATDHLLRGDGLRVHWWEEGTAPLTHFPPGEVVALAALTSTGLATDVAARLLNSAALAALALLAFGLARRASNDSFLSGLAGAAAVVLSRDVLAAHAMIWSEPLYLALMLGALLSTVRAIERDSMGAIVAAAALTGVAGLTRYVVPSLIGAIALSLLLFGSGQLGRRGFRAFVYVLIAALPLALLFVFNASQGNAAVNRQLGFHPPGFEKLVEATRTAYYWIIPLRAPTWLEATVFAACGLAVAALAVALKRSWRSSVHVSPAAMRVRGMLALVTLGYAAFLFTALTLYDAQSTPDSRLLLPMVPPLAILLVALLGDAMRVPQRRVPAIAMSAALATGLVSSAANWVVVARRQGLGYNSPTWRESPVMAAIRGMGPETIVYTNHPGAILYQTGREVPGIPRLANPNSLQPNASWAAQMAAICERAASRRVVYAHFTLESSEWFLPSLSEVRRRLRSRPGVVAREGILDTVPASCAADRANAGE